MSDTSVQILDFFIILPSQNLKYKNESSKPLYMQYALAANITAVIIPMTARLLIRFNMLYGSFVEKSTPAIKNG